LKYIISQRTERKMVDSEGEGNSDEHHQRTAPPDKSRDGATEALQENSSDIDVVVKAIQGDLKLDDGGDFEDEETIDGAPVADLLSSCDDPPVSEQPPKSTTCEDWTVEKICEGLKTGKFKNIIVFTGAGISTSAGIPDFRTPGTGLYDNLQAYDLSEPEDIFNLSFFRNNPKPFYTLAKELMPGKYAPTITHHFIAMLQEKGILRQYFTQNIDGLDKLAGISDDKLVQVHGNFDSGYCTFCEEKVDQSLINEAMEKGEPLKCPDCNLGWVKPDITFFGEALPDKFMNLFGDFDLFNECDLIIIIGTSLQVGPSNRIPKLVNKKCPRLLINREPSGGVTNECERWLDMINSEDGYLWYEDHERELFRMIEASQGEAKPSRDAFLKSDADDGCLILAEALGVKEELQKRFSEKKLNFYSSNELKDLV